MSKIKNIDSLKIANTVPSKDDKINMIAKLVCETASLQRKNENLTNVLNELEEWLKEQWYEIEPKGTGIIFNCEYDSEEDYVRGMETKSKLDTLKNTLNKIQELKEKYK